MEPSTLVRRSARIVSKNAVDTRAKRACARTIQKENVLWEKNLSVKKNSNSNSVEVPSLNSFTNESITKSRNGSKRVDDNSLPPNAAKVSSLNGKENLKTSSFDTVPKSTDSSNDVLIPNQLRRSERRLNGTVTQNHPKEPIDQFSNLVSSVKKLVSTERTLFENGAAKNSALIKQTTYDKNEIVMAKMAGHMIWPAKVIFIIFWI